MTIGRKLALSVAAMLSLMIAMSATSLYSIRSINAELEAATVQTARRLQLAGAMDAAGADMLAGMRGIILFTFDKDPSRVEKCVRQADAAAATWQQSIDEVRPLVVREEGKRIVEHLQDQLTAWRGIVVEVRQLAAKGDPSGAEKVARDKGFPIYEANRRDTLRFQEIQNEILLEQRAAGNGTFRFSLWVAFTVLSLALIAGAGSLYVVSHTSRTLQDATRELSESAAQVASAAAQISASSQTLAQGAAEQAASLEETSASSEEISTMTQKNAEDSQAAAGFMNDSSEVVAEANRTLTQMEASMQEINESSRKIGKIIKVIDEIAFQTNILALNAAVEAARAGEAGMGFAVVADEVRSLAQRSAQAAKDTAGMIEESIAKSNEGRLKLDHVSHAIHAITEANSKVRLLIDAVSEGSGEQSRGVEEISKAIVQLEQITQSSASGAEEAACAGKELSSQASGLKSIVQKLEGLVGVSA